VGVDLGDVAAGAPFPATFVDAGNGDDRIDVTRLAAGRTVTVAGGLGHDAVNIRPGSLGTVAVEVISTGLGDAVTFMGTDGDDTFEIASRQVKQGDRSVVFQELPYPLPPWGPFTLSGGGGNDRFVATAPVPRGMVLDGGDGDDRFEFQPLWAGPSVPFDPAPPLAVLGGPGLDTVVADSRAALTGTTYAIGDSGIGRIPRGDAEALAVWGGSGGDTFRVTPGTSATITVAGNDPAAGAPTGDRLVLVTDGAAGRQFVPSGDGAGRYTFDNRRAVDFSGIEFTPEFIAPEVTSVRFLDTSVPFLVFKFSEPVTGLGASLLTIENVATGARRAASSFTYTAATNEASFGFVNLPDGQYRATLARGNVIDASGNRLPADVPAAFENVNAPHVAGRHVFYNNSALDGNNPGQNAADDAAVAADKRALLPGQAASFANVVGSAAGINGVMLDLARVGSTYTPRASDFAFFASDASSPGGWRTLPAPAAMTFRRGAGDNGSDRVTFTWPDGTVRNAWLRVVVSPTNTRLAAQDVFSFGNLVGETGDAARPLRVTALDLLAARRAGAAAGPANGTFDFNHDGRVNALDLAAVRLNLGRGLASPPPAAKKKLLSFAERWVKTLFRSWPSRK